jgi:hypothetical protein
MEHVDLIVSGRVLDSWDFGGGDAFAASDKPEVKEGRVVGAVLVGRSTPGRYSAGTTSATIPTFVRLAETKSTVTLSRSGGSL